MGRMGVEALFSDQHVCLCVSERWGGSLIVVCVFICAGEREGGIMGEAKDEENERAS